MIIGFLGKGGSGKSTLATLLTKHLLESNKQVLAIDADHNMDFSYNLGLHNNIPYFGKSIGHIKEFIGLDSTDNYRLAFFNNLKNTFSIFPNDNYTSEYSTKVKDNLQVMVAGPHTDELWLGNGCSHGLFTSLKIYLPFLILNTNQYVVVDEKAGMDPVGTMVPAGFDFAIVVSEPTPHSAKTANQIIQGLQKYKTPYIVVGNKVSSKEQENVLEQYLWEKPFCTFGFDITKIDPSKTTLTQVEINNFNNILTHFTDRLPTLESREKRCVDFWTGIKGKAQT